VQSGFEIKQDVLVDSKADRETARKWGSLSTAYATARYTGIRPGERFYLKTPEQLADGRNEARAADRILSQLREFRYFTQAPPQSAMLDRVDSLRSGALSGVLGRTNLTMLSGASGGQRWSPRFQRGSCCGLKVDFATSALRRSEQADVPLLRCEPYHVKIDSSQIRFVLCPRPETRLESEPATAASPLSCWFWALSSLVSGVWT
jgi:hypothetical protein